jgi:phospholipid/cholesterol/gamma-HCH transport system substrate-binding protein
MQKQAPTFGRLLTMVLFALSCFGLLLFLWLSFGGSIPLEPQGYRFHVAFPEATQLGLEADVREAGVNIGKVVDKTIDSGHRNRTIATIQLDSKYAPIPSDARAILRQKTLLGETYVELTPGTPGASKVAENGWLADSRVANTVQLDEIFNAFDPQTRQAFRTWQQQLAKAVDNRGQDLNDALGNLPQFASDANDVLGVLDSQTGAVRRLVKNTGVVFDALSQNQAQLHNLITGAGNTFAATSRQEQALAQTFQIFPTFLDESKATFKRLESFSKDADPVIRQLQPAIHDLAPTLQDARALAPDLRSFFQHLDPLITASKQGLPALRDVLDGTRPLLGQLQPFLEQLNPVLQWLEYYQRDTADFFSNGAGGLADTVPTGSSQEIGHYLRQFAPKGAETAAMYPNRPAASRGNAYLTPTALSGPKHDQYMIFPNHDCENTGVGEHKTQTPAKGQSETNDMPSCFVQTPPSWPPGNTHQYPRIGPANYSKPSGG